MNSDDLHATLFVLIFILAIGIGIGILVMGITTWMAHGSHDPESMNNYKDCIESKLPADICNLLYPPVNIQNVNWNGSMVPFP